MYGKYYNMVNFSPSIYIILVFFHIITQVVKKLPVMDGGE